MLCFYPTRRDHDPSSYFSVLLGEDHAPVVGMWEGGLLRVEAGRVDLIRTPARLFRKGREPVDVEPGGDLARLLSDS